MMSKLLRYKGLLSAGLIAGGLYVIRASAEDAPAAPANKKQEPAKSQPSTKSDSLKQLEESLFKPAKSISEQNSLDVAPFEQVHPPQQPSAQSKRARELMDRRKNWIFMTPEELVTAQTTKDTIDLEGKGDDAQGQMTLTPMERYLQKLYFPNSAKPSPAGSRLDSAL